MNARTRVPAWADRLYAALLRTYPESFREEYAGEMRAAFRSRWREERQTRGLLGVAGLWLSVLLDTLTTAVRSQWEMLDRDLRYAWRSLTGRQSWAFTTAALLTLALGIGAVTAIFTFVHAVLLAPLPFHEPDRVVRILDTDVAHDIDSFTASMPNFRSWRQASRSFSHLAAFRGANSNLTSGGQPERVTGLDVSANLWELLGVRPVAGRAFVEEDDAPGHAPVAMISEGLWRRRFGGESSVVGSTIDVNLVPHVVVGIAPQSVGFTTDVDLWRPLGHDPELEDNRGDHRLVVLGRLAPGVSVEQAQGDLQGIAARLAREFPETNEGWSVRVVSVRDWIVTAEESQRLHILLAAVTLLLLVAATNVANLQVARATGRLREIGVRLALGASRARLVRQMLTENLLLAAAGGAMGFGLAWGAVRLAGATLPDLVPVEGALVLNVPVLLVAVVCIGATALLTGLLPARMALRYNVQGALQQAGRSTTGGRSPARHVLVAVQLALATTLMACAALLTQSLLRLQEVELGFADPDHLLTTQITRSVTTEEMLGPNREFYETLVDEVRALPGVAAAGVSNLVPFDGDNTSMAVSPVPRPEGVPEEGVQASWRIVTADYFQTLQIPLRQGRLFAPRGEGRHSMVLSEGLARRLWPAGEDPLGRQVQLGNGQTYDVVGVVGDVRQLGLRDDPEPAMYMPTTWYLMPTMTLTVRAHGEPEAIARSVGRTVARLDPHQPLSEFQTLRSAIAASAAAPRLHTFLLASFAGLALLLAAVGVAGVVGYAVGQRTRELAVRLALGASPGQAMRHVLSGSLLTCAAGILVGIGAALALGRTLSGMLYGVGAHDPLTFLATAAVLLAAATIACWLPAQRATRIDPCVTLREG
ncbi:MAG TPA: ABC transporter permease [Thermoanaerobaculia bacterium]|nr:ABC transporter permease [Thermoanaerobaculia bacterium]